jgi:hypothetical protein
MSETGKTIAFAGVALLLVMAAWATAPRMVTPSSLQERGTPFFPAFTDPNAVTSLEVVEFDEPTFVARPFKVLNRDGRWTIPSHYDHPADGADRLATIAAAVISLKKDDVASENVGDHEKCGVLDPIDETLATSKGRGTRVTVLGSNENVLADIILGGAVQGREHLRYVRLPGQNRTYVARVGSLGISTKFEDWIERDLLQVERDDVDAIAIRSYVFDAKRDNVADAEALVLRRTDRDVWMLNGIGPTESTNTFRMNLLVTRLDDLTIAGVRPKPPGLAATLGGASAGKISEADAADLETKGFYSTRDGALLSIGGEVLVRTDSGVVFQLRFGDVVPDADPSTSHADTGERQTPAENRYLMISAGFDPAVTPRAPPSAEVQSRLALLRTRFAPWYYVVSEDSYKDIRLQRRDLVN